MKCVYVEPGRPAMVVDANFDQIKATLGWMSASYPYEDNVAFLHDDDGIARNRLPNRTINGEIMPGPFFIVFVNDSGDLDSLPDDLINHYLEKYKKPEIFAPGHWEVSSTVEETEYTAIIKNYFQVGRLNHFRRSDDHPDQPRSLVSCGKDEQ